MAIGYIDYVKFTKKHLKHICNTLCYKRSQFHTSTVSITVDARVNKNWNTMDLTGNGQPAAPLTQSIHILSIIGWHILC